ncbi:dihydroxyacetone kinase subunit DhaL [Ornithinimicrobium panacihumi]|uniref:dihydroxyacetone kinase subunit DhaL n=1 Tax=Ornithinimicrobium panacihumi TaxID=2008449 RepID=UPI003F88E161
MADLQDFQAWLARAAELLAEHSEHLTDLDRAIGDGDHGTNVARGFGRCAELADAETFGSTDAYLKKVGMTLVSTVGGASGPLYGTFFLRLAGPVGGSQVDAVDLGRALAAGVEGVVARGRAEVGDKTMYDALAPAVRAYDDMVRTGAGTGPCLAAALAAAEQGRDGTAPLVARKGRASYLGERSAGHIDPGAASAVLLLQAAAETLS